jgi:hypothetical protein
MKNHRILLLTALATTAIGLSALAQDAGGPRPGERGPGPRGPKPPLIEALDPNNDGVIDQQEIANASAALQKLDKNGDGKLTLEELRPPQREGEPGPGGPHGQGSRPRGEQPGRPQRPPSDQ